MARRILAKTVQPLKACGDKMLTKCGIMRVWRVPLCGFYGESYLEQVFDAKPFQTLYIRGRMLLKPVVIGLSGPLMICMKRPNTAILADF